MISGNQPFLSIWSSIFHITAFSSHACHIIHRKLAVLDLNVTCHQQCQHVRLTVCVAFLVLASLVETCWYFIMVLIYISLMSNMISRYFIYSFVNVYSGLWAILCLIELSFSYWYVGVLDTDPLLNIILPFPSTLHVQEVQRNICIYVYVITYLSKHITSFHWGSSKTFTYWINV